MIAEDLKALAVPLDNLELMEGNPRKGDIDSVKRSYEAFGQRKPIVARRTGIAENGLSKGIVTAGNHQLQAARALKWKEIAVVFIDEDEQTSKAFSVADNRTHDLGTYDDTELKALLKEIEEFDEALFAATSYSLNDIEQTLSTLELDSEQGNEENRGELLSLLSVAYGEPKHQVQIGDIWKLGSHIMVIADVMKDWNKWVNYLEDGLLFVPYPGPYVALTKRLDKQPSVMVQPNVYLAGHILDKYVAVHGADSVRRTHRD